jgi:hypothetical protein
VFSEWDAGTGNDDCNGIQSPSLQALATGYAGASRHLADISRNAAGSIRVELEVMPMMTHLMLHRQQIVQVMAGMEARSDDDLVAMLEVWRAENVSEGFDDISESDKLVLSVLDALRQRI